MGAPIAILTHREVAMLIALAGRLDPDVYPATETKALLYKCKAMVESIEEPGSSVNVRVVSG